MSEHLGRSERRDRYELTPDGARTSSVAPVAADQSRCAPLGRSETSSEVFGALLSEYKMLLGNWDHMTDDVIREAVNRWERRWLAAHGHEDGVDA